MNKFLHQTYYEAIPVLNILYESTKHPTKAVALKII